MSSKSAKRNEPMCGCNTMPMERTDPRAYVMPQNFTNCCKDAEPCKGPEISSETDRLQISIANMEDKINQLLGRIEPVLSCSKPQGMEKSPANPVLQTKLGATLGMFTERVDALYWKVDDIINRVEL